MVSSILAKVFTEMGHKVFFVACLKSPYSKMYVPAVEQTLLPDKTYDSVINKQKLLSVCADKKIEIILNQAGNIAEFTRLCAFVSKEQQIPLISAIHINPLNKISAIKDYKFSAINKFSYLKGFGRMLLMPLRYRRIYMEEQILYGEVCSTSDKVVLLSKGYLKELEYLTGKGYLKNVIAIANPVNSKFLNKPIIKEKIVLFVGRLDFDHKRPDRLICIWERMYKNYPDWKLKFAGDGPFKKQLMDYIVKKGIRNVEFLGFCDTSKQYQNASILCLTSTIEGLPMVLLEGISYGCIPLSFDSFNSVFDVIENNKNGFIIQSYHLKKYEIKLRLLMDNEELRATMCQESIESSHKFEPHSMASDWISLFTEAINTKKHE